MRAMTWAAVLLSTTVATGWAQPAGKPAPRKPPPPPVKIEKAPTPVSVVGLQAKGAFAPERGFIDDVVTTDGKRLGIVVTDGASEVEIQVISTEDGGELARVNVAAIAPQGVRRFYLVGEDRLFVVADGEDGALVGATLIGFDGKVIKAQKPATDHTLMPYNGADAVYSYTRDPKARGGTAHQIEVFDLLKAKKLTKKPGRLLIGKDGRDAKIDFKPAYFTDGMTVAVGTRGGIWRKSEDQRSPDTAAAYNLLTGKWVSDEPIADLLNRARNLEIMTEHARPLFARMKDDLSAVEIWRAGVARPVNLDQPLENYDAATLAYGLAGDGAEQKLWISLMVDPVNPAAINKKKADPEYLDLFLVDGDRAVRKARIYAPKKKLRWGWVGDRLWVAERNIGFDRGSKLLTLYGKPAQLM
jgi:hypothetical protein